MVDYGPWMSMVALTRSIQFVKKKNFWGRSWISFQAIGNWNFVRLMRPIAECHRVKLVISSCSTWGRSWNASRRHRNDFFWSACQTCFTCLSVITCEIRDLKLTGTVEAFRDVDGSVTWRVSSVMLSFGFLMSGGLFAVMLFLPGLTFFLFGMEQPDIMTCVWFGLLRPWDHHCGRVTTARHIEGMLHLPHWDVSGGGMVGLWSH